MFRVLFTVMMATTIAGCSSVSSYIPFVNNEKKVINLDQDKIDQKSYAAAYAATVQTYSGRVNEGFDVNSFSSGVNDWYRNRILVPLDEVKAKLYQSNGIDSQVYAYYSGVVFAAELQNNFNRLSTNCWSQIETPSVTQGIYDAMLDLQKGKAKSADDEYIAQGNDQILKICVEK
ncbi:hypothetical protein ACIWO4_10780 [Avibacterium paragallinarum]|uniref:hypothetical protein n=1 Tax=Avibacterium paragallinarum TaxID=728 RepID=UPI0021F72177|nr:hypothetical protein [Avibacterium paragallinarum]UXN34933.1 hypothetical protein N8E86_01515 [Avibacterium paragallinarum]